jgi:hypothetical protein
MHIHSSITTKQNHMFDINTWRNKGNQHGVPWIVSSSLDPFLLFLVFFCEILYDIGGWGNFLGLFCISDDSDLRMFFWSNFMCVELCVCACIYRWKLGSFAFNLDCFDSAKDWWNWDAIGIIEQIWFFSRFLYITACSFFKFWFRIPKICFFFVFFFDSFLFAFSF